MQMLKVGDKLDGAVIVAITRHGVIARRKKYERLFSLDTAAAMAQTAWEKTRVRVTTKKET